MVKKRKHKKSRRFKKGTEIGDYHKGTGKRKFSGGFYTELYRGLNKTDAVKRKKILKKDGKKARILKKKDGYSVYYRKT